MKANDLSKLKDKLKMVESYRSKLKTATGFSKDYIDKVLRGKRRSDKIIDAALDLIVKEKKKIEERKSLLK